MSPKVLHICLAAAEVAQVKDMNVDPHRTGQKLSV